MPPRVASRPAHPKATTVKAPREKGRAGKVKTTTGPIGTPTPKVRDRFTPATPAPATKPASTVEASKLMGVEPAPPALLEAMRKHGRVIEIAKPGSEEMRYLDYMGAEANVGGAHMDHILLRAHPTRPAIVEEFLHGTQSKLGLLDKYGQQACEVKVKEFMIRHAKLLGLDPPDVAILQKLLVEEKKLLAAQQGGPR